MEYFDDNQELKRKIKNLRPNPQRHWDIIKGIKRDKKLIKDFQDSVRALEESKKQDLRLVGTLPL